MSEDKRPAAIFDLDGVLIDSAEANVQAFRFGLEQVGIEVSDPQEVLRLVGYPAIDMLVKLGCPQAEAKQVFENFVRPFYMENLPSLASAYPAALTVVSELREAGFRIGACTSGDRQTQTAALEAIGLLDYIEEMQTPDDSEHGKPQSEYLLELVARLGEVGDLHHVEDSEVGLKMGLACGATTYFASYGNGSLSGEVEPHVILKNLKELPRAIIKQAATRRTIAIDL